MTPAADHDLSYYEVLEVPSTASPDKIKAAYRRLVRYWHPDTNPDPHASHRTQRINEAYEVLSDPKKRAAYDARPPIPRLKPAQIDWTLRVDADPLPSTKVVLLNRGGTVTQMGFNPTSGTFWEITNYDAIMEGDKLIEFTFSPSRLARLATSDTRTLYEDVTIARLDNARAELAIRLELVGRTATDGTPKAPYRSDGPSEAMLSPVAVGTRPSPLPSTSPRQRLFDLVAGSCLLVVSVLLASYLIIGGLGAVVSLMGIKDGEDLVQTILGGSYAEEVLPGGDLSHNEPKPGILGILLFPLFFVIAGHWWAPILSLLQIIVLPVALLIFLVNLVVLIVRSGRYVLISLSGDRTLDDVPFGAAAVCAVAGGTFACGVLLMEFLWGTYS